MDTKTLFAVTALLALAAAPGGVAQPEDPCIATAHAAIAALDAYGGPIPTEAAAEQVRAIAAACNGPSVEAGAADATAVPSDPIVDAEADAYDPSPDLPDLTSAAGAGVGGVDVTIQAALGRVAVKPSGPWKCAGTTGTILWENDITILGNTFTVVTEPATAYYALQGMTSNKGGKANLVGGSTHSFLNDIVHADRDNLRWTFADQVMILDPDELPTISFECYPPVNGVAQLKSAELEVTGFPVQESLTRPVLGFPILEVVAHGKTCSPIC